MNKTASKTNEPFTLSTCPVCGREKSFGQCPEFPKLWVCFSPDHPAWAGSYVMGAMHGYWPELPALQDARSPLDFKLSKLAFPATAEHEKKIYLESFGYPQFDDPGGDVLRRIWRNQVHRAMFKGLSIRKAKRFAEQFIDCYRESKQPPPLKAPSPVRRKSSAQPTEAAPKPQLEQSRPKGKTSSKNKPRIQLNVQ